MSLAGKPFFGRGGNPHHRGFGRICFVLYCNINEVLPNRIPNSLVENVRILSMWRSGDSIWELLPYSHHMEPRGRAQTLCLLSPLTCPTGFNMVGIRALCSSLVIPLPRLKHAPLGGVVLILLKAISF